MSQRDGHEWDAIPSDSGLSCCEDDCQQPATWNKVLISCDKSSHDGGNYCQQHAAEDGNLMAQDGPDITPCKMNGQTSVRFECGRDDRIGPVLGPYEWVQLTYGILRAKLPDQEEEINLAYLEDDEWIHDDCVWSDVVIFSASDSPPDEEDKYITLYNAAIEAIDHVAQANWDNRVQAAKRYLCFVARDDGNTKSLDEIQEKVNLD